MKESRPRKQTHLEADFSQLHERVIWEVVLAKSLTISEPLQNCWNYLRTCSWALLGTFSRIPNLKLTPEHSAVGDKGKWKDLTVGVNESWGYANSKSSTNILTSPHIFSTTTWTHPITSSARRLKSLLMADNVIWASRSGGTRNDKENESSERKGKTSPRARVTFSHTLFIPRPLILKDC